MMARYPLWGFFGLPWFVVIFICVDSRYNGATSSKVRAALSKAHDTVVRMGTSTIYTIVCRSSLIWVVQAHNMLQI